jgi:large subunit ribosomal protein L5
MNRFSEWNSAVVQKDLVYKCNTSHGLALPKMEKVVLNMGVGVGGRYGPAPGLVVLSLLGGQRAQLRNAKKSIAGFQLRSQQGIGCRVTLRGDRGYAFLENFVSLVLPNLREFEAFSSSSVDSVGNLNFGIPDVGIFPSLELLIGDKVWPEFFVLGDNGSVKMRGSRGKWKAKAGAKKKKVELNKGMGVSSAMGWNSKGSKKTFGMNVSVVTSTKNAPLARVFFSSFQLPFRV